MLPSLILVLSASSADLSSHEPAAFAQNPPPAPNPDEAEYEKRRKLADKDADKLWDLHDWCVQKKLDKDAKSCLRRIVQLKPDDEKAHKLLGEVPYDGKWFPSEKKVEEYKKDSAAKAAKEAEKAAKDKGLVKYKDQWVTPEDLPYLKKGLSKNDKGEWFDPEEQKKIAEGWVKQDLEWVSPQEKENIGKGLWKCGDKWNTLEAANEYHSELFHWWRIPHQGKFVLYTTCERKVAEQVERNLNYAYDDLVKCYGFAPPTPPVVIVLRTQQQYESFAAGDQEEGRQPSESQGLSSVHYAYFADLGVDPETEELLQWGVSYWDSAGDGPKWGIPATRQALGQSFSEALDPSTKAVEKTKEAKNFDAKAFWEEKLVPTWFRYAAAGYAERYYVDLTVGVGGDSRYYIKWSIDSLLKRGGMLPIKEVLDFEPANDKADETQTWFNRAGLLMYFMLDGKCAPVTEKLVAFQTALKTGKDAKSVAAAAKALETELGKHDTDLRKFAGL
jgi:hypothetical protein